MSWRKSAFSTDLINPWRLPVVVEFHDGQVGVVEKVDAEGNANIQLSGDQRACTDINAKCAAVQYSAFLYSATRKIRTRCTGR